MHVVCAWQPQFAESTSTKRRLWLPPETKRSTRHGLVDPKKVDGKVQPRVEVEQLHHSTHKKVSVTNSDTNSDNDNQWQTVGWWSSSRASWHHRIHKCVQRTCSGGPHEVRTPRWARNPGWSPRCWWLRKKHSKKQSDMQHTVAFSDLFFEQKRGIQRVWYLKSFQVWAEINISIALRWIDVERSSFYQGEGAQWGHETLRSKVLVSLYGQSARQWRVVFVVKPRLRSQQSCQESPFTWISGCIDSMSYQTKPSSP